MSILVTFGVNKIRERQHFASSEATAGTLSAPPIPANLTLAKAIRFERLTPDLAIESGECPVGLRTHHRHLTGTGLAVRFAQRRSAIMLKRYVGIPHWAFQQEL
jgi:hypothetical protein